MKQKVAVIGLSGQSIMGRVLHFPNPGETIQMDSLHIEPGGKGYNQAIALAKLGIEVSFLSSVGDDEAGRICKKVLEEYHVHPFLVMKKLKTALATVLTNHLGENQVCVYPGASSELTEEDITHFSSEIKDSSFLLMQLEQPLNISLKMMEIANKQGVPVVLNPAPAVEYSFELLQGADLITPNEQEATIIFDFNKEDSDDVMLRKLHHKGLKQAVVTLGKEGAVILNQDVKRIPALKVQTIDTVGAGDAFNAGLIYGLINDYGLVKATSFATVVAGLSTRKAHVITSYPSLLEVLKILSIAKKLENND